jgi:hypothetical protein
MGHLVDATQSYHHRTATIYIEHSAGSGKSNTIGWLTHRLAPLHDAQNQRIFDSAIVVTDRVVLDQQLQDTIYQFEHKRGVVQKIDESSWQLAEARDTGGTGTLPTRREAAPGGAATGGGGRAPKYGGAVPQHGQARPAGEPEFLRLYCDS